MQEPVTLALPVTTPMSASPPSLMFPGATMTLFLPPTDLQHDGCPCDLHSGIPFNHEKADALLFQF